MEQQLIDCACGCGQKIRSCDNRGRSHIFKQGHNSWKGGKSKMYGYVRIQNRQGDVVLEHRSLYEQHHKCSLLSWAHIHHKNRIRDDNKLENLQGMINKNHAKIHAMANHWALKDMTDRICVVCNSKTTTKRHWYKFKMNWICHRCYCQRKYINKK
jgi:hypothetical protein